MEKEPKSVINSLGLIREQDLRSSFFSSLSQKILEPTEKTWDKAMRDLEHASVAFPSLKIMTLFDKSLCEMMYSQIRCPLNTFNDELNSILQLNATEKVNDTLELFYTRQSSLIPIIYRIILGICSPRELRNQNFENFMGSSIIIFDYNNLFDKEEFEKGYLSPFFYSAMASYFTENQKILSEIYLEYRSFVLSKIWIISYYEYIELLLKLKDLPNMMTKISEVALVIVDSLNQIINQSINFNHEEEVLMEEKTNRKINISFKKKRKSVGNDNTTLSNYDYISLILKSMDIFQKEFNFNLIYTLIDFDRVESLPFLESKKGDEKIFDFKKTFDLSFPCPKNINNKISFLFQIKKWENTNKILCVEGHHQYVINNTNFFSYIYQDRESKDYICRAFFKNLNEDSINLLGTQKIKRVDTIQISDKKNSEKDN
jgi:hypothetical protein